MYAACPFSSTILKRLPGILFSLIRAPSSVALPCTNHTSGLLSDFYPLCPTPHWIHFSFGTLDPKQSKQRLRWLGYSREDKISFRCKVCKFQDFFSSILLIMSSRFVSWPYIWRDGSYEEQNHLLGWFASPDGNASMHSTALGVHF